uniref:RIKEN cDNA 4930469K13 gene n=2 Tax=Mus TaxID=862507 RepID=A0A286YDX3_MOUSE
MFKNNHHDHKQKVEAMIKNINTISLEVKKMKELSQILLCDLNLQFGQPKKTEDHKEAEASHPFEEPEIPDGAPASVRLSD